jgi:hypothetical protein
MPDLNKIFSLEAGADHEQFPGSFYVFNGHKSVLKKVEQGVISFRFSSATDVSGEYDVILTDYDSRIYPAPEYRLAGSFFYIVGSSGPAFPLPDEIIPLNGEITYDRSCSGCHRLGKYDVVSESASDLSMRGGELPLVYPGATTEHQSVELDLQAMHDIKIFLNAW